MRPIEAIVMTVSTLVFGVAVAVALVDRDLFYGFVVVEDGFLEWTTVVAMGAAAVVSLRRLLKGYRTFGVMKRLALLSDRGPCGVRNGGGDFLGAAHPQA